MNTGSAIADSNLDTVLTLPECVGTRELASACRETMLAFMNESSRWGKAELAMWLMGPYARLTQYVTAYTRRQSGETPRPALPLLREIDARIVDRLMAAARAEVASTLHNLRDAEAAATFAFSMIAAGFVARCEDTAGVSGWIPTTAANRLADRVLSLVAVDYLTRAADYDDDFAICSQCGALHFDRVARTRGVCNAHHSGFLLRRAGNTLPYLPEGA